MSVSNFFSQAAFSSLTLAYFQKEFSWSYFLYAASVKNWISKTKVRVRERHLAGSQPSSLFPMMRLRVRVGTISYLFRGIILSSL